MNIPHTEAYRIKKGYGLSPIRNKREMKALLEFCRNELKDKEQMKLNPDRKRIYATTLKLYDQWVSDERYEPVKFKPVKQLTEYYEPHTFINDHCEWYWN